MAWIIKSAARSVTFHLIFHQHQSLICYYAIYNTGSCLLILYQTTKYVQLRVMHNDIQKVVRGHATLTDSEVLRKNNQIL